MPDDKYLYKIPSGKYKVTTTWKKLTGISVVKDEIGNDPDSAPYSECLQHVDGGNYLTAGDDDFNGNAKKEITITVGEDESVFTGYTKESIGTPGSIKFYFYSQE